ncbi:MAG: TetR/AcrR family transcriptional regulator [Acidimicrobiales bacterium]
MTSLKRGVGTGAGDISDGRRQRAARNREAVVTALLEIIRERQGDPVPGAAEVAARAGVSERTVFRHFADLDSLFLAAAEQQRPTIVASLSPRPHDKELAKRIATIVRLRSKMHEEITPVRRVAMRLSTLHSSLSQAVAEATRAGRQQLADVFEPELTNAGKNKTLVLDEIELVAGWPAWETLRRHQECSPERTRYAVTDLMTAILGPYADE